MPPEEFLRYKEQVLSKKHKSKSHTLDNNIKTKKDKKKRIKKHGIGEIVYYIKENNDISIPSFEIKEGVIIGYSNNQVLVKDFYLTKENKIESNLIAITPLTKEQALFIKAKYDKSVSILIQQQLTR